MRLPTAVLLALVAALDGIGAEDSQQRNRAVPKTCPWVTATKEAEALKLLWNMVPDKEAGSVLALPTEENYEVAKSSASLQKKIPKKVLVQTFWVVPDPIRRALISPRQKKKTFSFSVRLQKSGNVELVAKKEMRKKVDLYSFPPPNKNAELVTFRKAKLTSGNGKWTCAVFVMKAARFIDPQTKRSLGFYLVGESRVVLFSTEKKAAAALGRNGSQPFAELDARLSKAGWSRVTPNKNQRLPGFAKPKEEGQIVGFPAGLGRLKLVTKNEKVTISHLWYAPNYPASWVLVPPNANKKASVEFGSMKKIRIAVKIGNDQHLFGLLDADMGSKGGIIGKVRRGRNVKTAENEWKLVMYITGASEVKRTMTGKLIGVDLNGGGLVVVYSLKPEPVLKVPPVH